MTAPYEQVAPAAGPQGVLRRAFARRTRGRFIPEIDGLRFPAIAIVVIGHLCAYFREAGFYPPARSAAEQGLVLPIAQSGKGVFLFFVISGFVLALPFVRQHLAAGAPVSLRDYLWRRVTRLEPPYLISLTVFLALKLVTHSAGLSAGAETTGVLVQHYLASAAYLHNLIYGGPSVINGVAWSLEIEIQFYLLVPILATIFLIRSAGLRRLLLVAASLAGVVLQARYGATPNRWAYSIAGNLHFFLLGFLLADLYVAGRMLTSARTGRWDLVGLLGWPTLFVVPLTGLAFPAVLVLVFVAAFRGRLTNRAFVHPVVSTIGGMCYSIYLLHFLLLSYVGRTVFRHIPSTGRLSLDVALQAPLLLAVVLGVSALYFLVIERPCMDRNWPSRLSAAVRRRLGLVPESQRVLQPGER